MDTQTTFAEPEFKDTPFMPAAEKVRVLNAWERFLKSNLARENFTEALYMHLINHCSFIAHYSRQGFWDTYFVEPEDTIHFLSQFDDRDGIPKSVEYGMTYWYTDSSYNDINAAMCRIGGRYIPALVKKLEAHQQDKDLTRARLLMAKHGIYTLKANE